MDPGNEPQSIAALAKDKCNTSCMSFVSEVSESRAHLCSGALAWQCKTTFSFRLGKTQR